jgi:hypothetical protein
MELNVTNITPEDQVYVDRLRRFLNDSAELNVLTELQESTDKELFEALQDALDKISFTTPIVNTAGYEKFNEVPWFILRLGAALNILTTKGILSARNTLTYRDSGGVTVQNYDKYGRYINYFNILVNQFERSVQQFKVNKNIDNCYGNIPSEYSLV